MGQAVLDKQTGNQIFFPDHTSTDEIQRANSDFNNGAITTAHPDWYTQYIKRPLEQMGASITDPIMTARSFLGGAREAIQPLVPFNISPTPQEKEAFKDVSPVANTVGGVSGQIPSFIALEAITGGIGGLISKIPQVAKGIEGINAAKEAGTFSEQGLKVASSAANFGAVTGEYGALADASQQKQQYGNIDWHDVSQEAAKQAGFGIATGGVFGYISKPLSELGTAEDVIKQSSKLMLASGTVMAAQASANGASPRDIALNFGMGSILAGIHLHGEIEGVRTSSLEELQNMQARYLLSQTGADESVASQISHENTSNHAHDVINEAVDDFIKKHENVSYVNGEAVKPVEDEQLSSPAAILTKSANDMQKFNVKKAKTEGAPSVSVQFKDPYEPQILDYLAQYIPARAVALMNGEERLKLANGPWQDLQDISAKYESGELPEKPTILNDKSNIMPSTEVIKQNADKARGIPKTVIDEVATSKTLTTNLVNKIADQVISVHSKSSQSQPIQGEAPAGGIQTPSETTTTKGATNEETQTKAGQEVLSPEPLKNTAASEKTSGLSSSVEQSAIKEGLIKDLGNLPTYEKRNMDEVASKVSDFINNDYDLAKKIALGDAPEQDGIRSQELFTGLRVKAEAEGDVNTLRDLALSDKASAMATELGQRVKALDAGVEDSPIEAIKQIKKAREDEVVKKSKSKSIDKEKSNIVKEIKKSIKNTTTTKETWESFVQDLQC